MLQNRLYTVKEIATIINMSEYNLRKLIRDGKLRTACKRGLNYMISLDNLREMANKYPSKYSYILNILSNERISLEYNSDNKAELKGDNKVNNEEVLQLKIRIKELEIKLLKYESKFGPLE